MIIYKGFKYRYHRQLLKTLRWACSSNKFCKATIHTLDGVVVKELGQHKDTCYLKKEQTILLEVEDIVFNNCIDSID